MALIEKAKRRHYFIPVLTKALNVLEALQASGQPLSMDELHLLTKISKTTIYRILKTFTHRGYLRKMTDGRYQLSTRPRKLRFGLAAQSAKMPFSVTVTNGLKEAAAAAGVELLILDNAYDAVTAIRNAEEFVANRVDLVIEFQIEHEIAPVIAEKIAAAGIPMIAIGIPHPNAVFFGVNNYRIGFEAGETLGEHALAKWNGSAEWVVGLELAAAGSLVQSRITGAFEGVRSVLKDVPVESFVRMDTRGMRDVSRDAVAEFLRRHPKDRHILIAAVTDTSALGAVEAVRGMKREGDVAIVGHDFIPEAEQEMRRARSPLIGSVSHETQTYGSRIVALGLEMLAGETVAPYNYVEHRMMRRAALK